MLFIFGIVVLIFGIIFGICYAHTKESTKWGIMIAAVALVICIGSCFSSCLTSVPTGHTGIVTTFGKVEDYTYEAGIHFKSPFQKIIKMDNRNQKQTLELACFSSDIQEVNITYTVNYQIQKENAQTIYRSLGINYCETVMLPRIQEAVKSSVAKYNAETLISERNQLSEVILTTLKENLKEYNIDVVSAAIEDIDFTDIFTNAVEAKQVAAQNLLKAQTEQEQKTMEQEATAKRSVIEANASAEIAKIQAQADLEVTKIQADAAEYAGQKDAAINKAISESLTSELNEYYYIKQWDGKLPTITGTDTVIPMFDSLAE